MSLQWFSSLAETILKYSEYLNNKGALALSTLLDTNFPQWQNACRAKELPHYQDMTLTDSQLLKP